jgi:hypothetical protein
MNKRRMFRQSTSVAAGIAMVAGFGLAGVGATSAAAPALHIGQNGIWTLEVMSGKAHWCEQDTFDRTTDTFTSASLGDSGSWIGGEEDISMTWTAGTHTRMTFFSDKFVSKLPVEYYKGRVSHDSGTRSNATLYRGPVTNWHGVGCG